MNTNEHRLFHNYICVYLCDPWLKNIDDSDMYSTDRQSNELKVVHGYKKYSQLFVLFVVNKSTNS